jgi:hypothetical protein
MAQGGAPGVIVRCIEQGGKSMHRELYILNIIYVVVVTFFTVVMLVGGAYLPNA